MNTTPSESKDRQFRAAPFVLALLCFILPFVKISCGGQKVASLTGFQLATGTTLENKSEFSGQSQQKRIENNTCISIAAVCGILGIALAYAGGKNGKLLPAVAGAAGFISLIIAKVQMDNDALKSGQGVLTLEYQAGFMLACVFFLAAAAISGYQAKQHQ